MTIFESSWDGKDRSFLRWGLAVVCMIDFVLGGVITVLNAPDDRTRADAPRFLVALGGNWWAVAVVVSIGLVALTLWAKKKYFLVSATVALICLGIINESIGALVGGPMRFLFFGGVTLLGWTVGAWGSKILRSASSYSHEDERLAELGAVALLAMTYFNASCSKMLISGWVKWADPMHLLWIVLSHHNLGDPTLFGSYAELLFGSPNLTLFLSVLTLIFQTAAPLMVMGPRWRLAIALGIFSFHLNVFLLTHILFLQSMVLLLLFGVPWPWLRRSVADRLTLPNGDEAHVENDSPSVQQRTVLLKAGGSAAVLMLIAWVNPLRPYTTTHHHSNNSSQPVASADSGVVSKAMWIDPQIPLESTSELSEKEMTIIKGISVGMTFSRWTVLGTTLVSQKQIAIALQREGVRWSVFVIPKGVTKFSVPLSTKHYDLLYNNSWVGTLDPVERDQFLDALADLIEKNEAPLPICGGIIFQEFPPNWWCPVNDRKYGI